MDPQQTELPLADIHLPDATSIWPLAPGWWLLVTLIIIALYLISKTAWRMVQYRRQKRLALVSLNQINLDEASALSDINRIVKQVAMVYFPADKVAPLSHSRWQQFLESSSRSNNTFDLNWLDQSWKENAASPELATAYKNWATQWIKSALPPRKSVLEAL